MWEIIGELLIVVVVAAFCVGLHAIWQRRFRSEILRKHNDVAGFLFSAIGVIYAVVLGFVVVVVWEKYDATVSNVDGEVAGVSDLYRTASGLPEPLRLQVRKELLQYAADVANVEWPQMRHAAIVQRDLPLLEDVGQKIDQFKPSSAGEADIQQMALTQLERLFDARRARVYESGPSVPLVLWFALIAGALAVLAFAFMFGVENQGAQLWMTAILAGLIAILFIVIADFDHPFRGSVRISSDGWVILQQHLSTLK
ncbi:MAG TPA: DUF4239 domain-containing protein [Candidatus Tumulicola sp.]